MTWIAKSSRLERATHKWRRSVDKAREKAKADRAALAAWSKISAAVSKRDSGRCRVCGVATIKPGAGNPELFGGAHHIIYRSAGGKDELKNLVWTCAKCHEAAHGPHLDITGTSDALEIDDRRPKEKLDA